MVALNALQVSGLSVIPNRFYEFLKLKIECMFSQMQSHVQNITCKYAYIATVPRAADHKAGGLKNELSTC